MANIDRTQVSLFASAQKAPATSARSYIGVNNDRQSRFEARSARRWGDWSILEFPTHLLWLDETLAYACTTNVNSRGRKWSSFGREKDEWQLQEVTPAEVWSH